MMDDIMNRVQDHFEESLTMFDKSRIVGIFLQGSQNYGLQIPTSDVDTKLVVTPTFDEVVLNKKPISTTHVRANNEHISKYKDMPSISHGFYWKTKNTLPNIDEL